MIKLIDILKEITGNQKVLNEYNKSQLDTIAVKLNIKDRESFNSLMNKLDSQGIKYNDLKNKISSGEIKSIEDLEKLKTVSKSDDKKTQKEEGANKLFENDHFLIVEPLNEKASKLYGAGTKWCTTGKDDESTEFKFYTCKAGKSEKYKQRLIYIIDKTKPSTDRTYKMAYSLQISEYILPIDRKVIHMGFIPYLYDAKDKEYTYNTPFFKKYFKYMEENGVPIDNIFPIRIEKFEKTKRKSSF
jgi:hypothetical protein